METDNYIKIGLLFFLPTGNEISCFYFLQFFLHIPRPPWVIFCRVILSILAICFLGSEKPKICETCNFNLRLTCESIHFSARPAFWGTDQPRDARTIALAFGDGGERQAKQTLTKLSLSASSADSFPCRGKAVERICNNADLRTLPFGDAPGALIVRRIVPFSHNLVSFCSLSLWLLRSSVKRTLDTRLMWSRYKVSRTSFSTALLRVSGRPALQGW
jgi:hypothetical protein